MQHSFRVAILALVALIVSLVIGWIWDQPIRLEYLPILQTLPLKTISFILLFDILIMVNEFLLRLRKR